MAPLQILIATSALFPIEESHLEQIRQAAPGAALSIIPARDVDQQSIASANVIYGSPNPALLADAPNVKWIQLPSAGADRFLDIRSDILITKSSGVYGIPIAEWMIGTMLMLTRNLHLYRDQQHQAVWKSRQGAKEVHGSTVGIVGLGDIGQAVAARARALGCRVLGVRRRPGATPDCVDALVSLDELMPQTDFLMLATPGTPLTRGMISAERLANLKQGAYVINAGRGYVIDEAALIAQLENGHLAGAALDVTSVEPLPPDSPLWQMEQVVITPHVSGQSQAANDNRRVQIFCDNLRRFAVGETLHNLVDRQAGY